MKKILPIIIIVLLIGGAFYGGMRYGESRTPFGNFSRQNFQGSVEGSFQRGINRETGSGVLGGEVIAKDEQSLTLKLLDGSSKIVFFSDSTEISKMTDGLVDDIEIGEQIMVNGEQNSDGSYTAKTIQLSSPFSQ